MAQRISRAKRTLQGRRLDEPGDLAVVLRVLYLIYTAGHGGRVDLAGEAIRLARQLTLATEEPEVRGLLALMLLNHARLPARLDSEGRIVTLDRQDRSLWDTREIAEGVRVLQTALARQRAGRRAVAGLPLSVLQALHIRLLTPRAEQLIAGPGDNRDAPASTWASATSHVATAWSTSRVARAARRRPRPRPRCRALASVTP